MDLMSLIAAGTARMSVSGKNISAQGSYFGSNLSVSNGTRTGSGSSFENFLKSRVAEVQGNRNTETTTAYKENNSKAEVSKIIGELDIPDESKAGLRKELESLETIEDVKNFLENLEEVLMQNGLGVEETLIKFAQAFVAENAEKSLVPSAFDAAFVSTLKNKGYIENDPALLNEQELKAVKEAFEKILTPQDASIGKREMKIAEIIKPSNLTNALAGNTAANADANAAAQSGETEAAVNAAEPNTQVKAETGNLQGETAKQNAQAESEGNNFKTVAETSFRDAAATAVKSGDGTLESQEQPDIEIVAARDIKKIADFIEFSKIGDQKKLTVQLMPKELGKLNIELVDNAGKLTAKITMESDQAKNLLVNNAESIRLQLEAKGIVLEKMEFLFAEKDPDRGQEQFFKKKGSGSSGDGSASHDNSEDSADPVKGIYA